MTESTHETRAVLNWDGAILKAGLLVIGAISPSEIHEGKWSWALMAQHENPLADGYADSPEAAAFHLTVAAKSALERVR